MTLAVLCLLVLLIGVSLGVSGIGGFLVAPLLVLLAGVGPREAIADALISFIPSGMIGTALYARRHVFPWALAAALSIGTVPGVLAGREISLSLDQALLQRILAVCVLAATGLLLVSRGRMRNVEAPAVRRGGRATIAAAASIGGVGGVLAVLAGIGGPLVSVPVLLLLSVDVGDAVAASLLSSVVASALGAAALLPHAASPHAGVLAAVVGLQIGGIVVGVLLRPQVSTVRLAELVALTGIVASCGILWLSFR